MKDYNEFWEIRGENHSRHPSVRFRNHLILDAVMRISSGKKVAKILDIGCGDADLLKQLSCRLFAYGKKAVLSGYDISAYQIERNRLHGLPFDFRVVDFNQKIVPVDKFQIIICSEVLEHLKNWELSLQNIAAMNDADGYLILTTQSGRRFRSDSAIGHLQHFELNYLMDYLKALNYDIIVGEKRGFPFYNLQKALNSAYLPASEKVVCAEDNFFIRALFIVAYFLFRISIKSKKLGPQIFILARKIPQGIKCA